MTRFVASVWSKIEPNPKPMPAPHIRPRKPPISPLAIPPIKKPTRASPMLQRIRLVVQKTCFIVVSLFRSLGNLSRNMSTHHRGVRVGRLDRCRVALHCGKYNRLGCRFGPGEVSPGLAKDSGGVRVGAIAN